MATTGRNKATLALVLLTTFVLTLVGLNHSYSKASAAHFTNIMAPKLKNNTELSAAEWAKPQTFTKILKTYFPNISNSELLELTLRKRVHDIRMRCKEYMGVTRKWRGRRPEIIMVSSATIEYCCTAKTGTQFWKTLIPKVRERLRDFSTPDSGGKIRITTMRNPWHRLVSFYQQKVEFYNEFGKTWRDGIRQHCAWKRFDEKPDFRNFVQRCVIDQWRNGMFERHWLPITDRCNICEGHYDYIIDTSRMNTEGPHVLEMAGVEEAEHLFEKVRAESIRSTEKRKASSNYSDYYQELSPEEIETVRSIYARDLFVLDYPSSPYMHV